MQERHTDQEIMHLLRTAGWLWLGYLLALLLIDWLLYKTLRLMLIYYLINGCAALIFLGLAYWDGLAARLKSFFLPLMLGLIAILPLVVNHLMSSGAQPGSMSSPEGMALRQLPVLFVALVITAWRYRLAGVILFSGGTALVELLSVVFLAPLIAILAGPAPAPPRPFSPTPFRIVFYSNSIITKTHFNIFHFVFFKSAHFYNHFIFIPCRYFYFTRVYVYV